MTSSQPSDTFQPGDVLNNTYLIEEILGRGGTSEVYRAKSEISGRIVALKVLSSEFSSNDDYLVLMNREEEIRDVRHDAVVRYSENNRTADGHVYLVMDYVEGPSLEAKMKAGGMSADDLMIVAGRIAEGLHAIHSRNIVHRDLSPDNILLRDDDPSEAVIIDFGIAKDTNPGAATIVGNEFAGKYAYAAPEQLSGKSDPRSDIYALGSLLLATFRGTPPDVGNNPMMVIETKSKPLDTDGVPEPLKSLIDKMTDPSPDGRLQTADDVLDEIEPQFLQTVVPSRPTSVTPRVNTEKTKVVAAKESSSKRGGLLAIILLGAIGGGGYGAYVSGMFNSFLGPKLETVSPYILIAESGRDAPPNVVGFVPSEDVKISIETIVDRLGGTTDLTLAKGDIHEGWGAGLEYLISNSSELEEWRIAINDNTVNVTGTTDDRNLRARVVSSLQNQSMLGGFQGSFDIFQGPLTLSTAAVQTVLNQHADCGVLKQTNVLEDGYGIGDSISVSGALASPKTRAKLFDALSSVAGDREILIDTSLKGVELCAMEGFLATYPVGDFEVVFRDGASADVNASGEFSVGANPVIDVVIPEGVDDGFIWVSIADVTGNVFHLLPNVNRLDNSIRSIRQGENGPISVRVAYELREAAGDRSKLAFLVDETFGKSTVVVIHANDQVFDKLRPTTESVAAYAAALGSRNDQTGAEIFSLSTRDLNSVQ